MRKGVQPCVRQASSSVMRPSVYLQVGYVITISTVRIRRMNKTVVCISILYSISTCAGFQHTAAAVKSFSIFPSGKIKAIFYSVFCGNPVYLHSTSIECGNAFNVYRQGILNNYYRASSCFKKCNTCARPISFV